MCDVHELPPLAEDEYSLDTARVREFVAETRERIGRAAAPRAACELIAPLFRSGYVNAACADDG